MSNQDSRIVSSLVSPSSGGLLSSAKSAGRGLLDFGRSVGGGLMSGARAVGQNIDAEQLQKDIIDTQRFYQQAMMSQPRQVLGKDLGMLKNITPAGIAASLPSLRAQEASALQKPMIEELEAMAAMQRARGTGSLAAQKTSPKTYLTVSETGEMMPVETYFDKISGQRLVSGTNEPLPIGSVELGAGDLPNFENLDTFNKAVTEEEEKLIALDKFRRAVETAPEGYKRTLQGLNQAFQAFLADPDFEKGDLATGEARARLQGLIGRYKDDIVGGGVMTEQDALRVIEALGGEISAFNPSALTLTLVDSYREQSQRKYEGALDRYNEAYRVTLPNMAGKRLFAPRTAYVSPFAKASSDDDSQGSGSGLSPELRKQYDLD